MNLQITSNQNLIIITNEVLQSALSPTKYILCCVFFRTRNWGSILYWTEEKLGRQWRKPRIGSLVHFQLSPAAWLNAPKIPHPPQLHKLLTGSQAKTVLPLWMLKNPSISHEGPPECLECYNWLQSVSHPGLPTISPAGLLLFKVCTLLWYIDLYVNY